MGQEPGDGGVPPGPARGVEIGVTQKNQWPGGDRTQRPVEQVLPQPDLVRVAQAVAIFGPVENRRRGAERQQGDGAARMRDRDHQMGGRGQALHLSRGSRGEGAAGNLGQARARHLAPWQRRQVAHTTGIDRPARQERQRPVTPETPETLVVGIAVGPAVPVQVHARRQAGIARGGIPVRQA